jgi:hypothetical protein
MLTALQVSSASALILSPYVIVVLLTLRCAGVLIMKIKWEISVYRKKGVAGRPTDRNRGLGQTEVVCWFRLVSMGDMR